MAAIGRQLGPYERRRRVYGALGIWVFLVALYFLWEAATYTGLFGWISEWEFGWFGWSMPILNFAVLTGLFGAIGLLLMVRRKRDKEEVQIPELEAQALARAAKFRSVLLGLAGAFTVAAIVALLWTFTLPTFGPLPGNIVVGDPAPKGSVQSGPARLHGAIDYEHAALFTQSLILARREVWFAPVHGAVRDGAGTQYFAELPPGVKESGQPFNLDVGRTGILLRNGLPGSIRALYNDVGIPVAQPDYVLYLSPATVRFPFYIVAGQFALAGLIVLLVAGIQHRHVRRRLRAVSEAAN